MTWGDADTVAEIERLRSELHSVHAHLRHMREETARLRADVEKYKEWCRKLIEGGTFPGEGDGLRLKIAKLRATLEEIAAISALSEPTGLIKVGIKARAALEETK